MLRESPTSPVAAWHVHVRMAELLTDRRGAQRGAPSGTLKGACSGARCKTRTTLPDSAGRVKFCDGLTIRSIINRGNDI